MKDIFLELNRVLERGQNAVFARIIRQKGSAPRGTGTQGLILENGFIIGTLGGGYLEHVVMEKAKSVFGSQRSLVLKLALYGKDVQDTEMLCGGAVDIYLEFVSGKNAQALQVFSRMSRTIREGRRGVLATRITEGTPASDPGSRALVLEDGSVLGGIDGLDTASAQAFFRERAPRLIETAAGLLFIEPVSPPDVVYLFGAGHISLFVCPLAAKVGFRVVVIDDRKAFANPERFPEADEIRVEAFEEAVKKIHLNSNSYIVIVTRGHVQDLTVLRGALVSAPGYIGMIGSRRKRDTLYASLMQEGFSAQRLAGIHCPIGLMIHAQTPEEIAVSIVAELISARNAPGGSNEKAASQSPSSP